MSLFVETFGQEKLKLGHDEVVELINSAEGLTNKERRELLADWGEVSGKGVGGQHFEALLPDEEGEEAEVEEEAEEEEAEEEAEE